jgi:hypothetical protein
MLASGRGRVMNVAKASECATWLEMPLKLLIRETAMGLITDYPDDTDEEGWVSRCSKECSPNG